MSERFLNAIDSTWIGDVIRRKLEDVKRTDPDHIYIENIRSFFGFGHATARFFCELAVREGVFLKRIGYLCPRDRNVIRYVSDDETPPDVLHCRGCELEGREDADFPEEDLETIEVYGIAPGY